MTYMSRNPQVASVVLDDITTTTPSNPPSGKVKVVDRNGTLFVRNSSGAESAIGTNSSVGSGEKNYIENPSAAASISGWTAAGNLDAVRTATEGDLPRENTTKTGIKITSKSPVASGSSDRVYYDVNLDSVDISGRIMKLKWDQKITGTYAAGQLEVVITTQADRATAVATPFTSAIPASNGTFQTYFIAPSTETCSVVIRATTSMTASGGIVISDVVVGPNVQVQGSAIGAWKSYTPTISNFGTTSNLNFRYREVGGSLQIQGLFTPGTNAAALAFVSMPSGYTTCSSYPAYPANVLLGVASQNSVSGADDQINIITSANQTGVFFGEQSTNNGLTAVNATVFANSVPISFNVFVEVNELSSNVTLANRAVEEFAWNSGTWDADVTASGFGNGPSGTALGGALSALRTKRVRFQSAIQPTDSIEVEVSEDRITWTPVNDGTLNNIFVVKGMDSSGNLSGGVAYRYVSGAPTDLDVFFARYIRIANDDSPATDWPSANAYWRVRKVSGGASVGYPISSANIVGRTDGVAPSAGMVGETIVGNNSANVSTAAYGLDTTVTLTAGVWLVSAQAWHDSNANVSGLSCRLNIKGVTGSAATGTYVATKHPATQEGSVCFAARPVVVASGDATKTVVLQAIATGGATDTIGYVSATRIA